MGLARKKPPHIGVIRVYYYVQCGAVSGEAGYGA
jgi:hypothetical protein